MKLSEEFIQENGLNEEQVSALSGYFKAEHEQLLGKEVHTHVENSLSKIWGSVEERTGVQRNQGEKYADAIQRASDLYFEGQKTSLERQKNELEEKLKNFKGDDSLKAKLDEVNEQLSKYKERAALADDWEKNDYKGKYEKANEKLTSMERKIAFKDVMPQRPDTINKYEWDAKWKEWQSEILEKRNLVFDEDGNAWAVDKENEFKKDKLEDLAKQNAVLQEMLKGREQRGIGSRAKTVKVEGLPFELPENATSSERTKAIKEYLASQNITQTSKEYSAKFSELNAIAMGLGKKQAEK